MTYILLIVSLLVLAVVMVSRKKKTTRLEVDMVKIYDFDKKELVSIPSVELAQGMIQINIQGIEGNVWADPSQLKQSDYRHPPFEGQIKERIEALRSELFDVYPHDYEFWEDGFRRDENPESELDIWLRVAGAYKNSISSEMDLPDKMDVFRILASCMNSEKERINDILPDNNLSPDFVEKVIETYYKQTNGLTKRFRQRAQALVT